MAQRKTSNIALVVIILGYLFVSSPLTYALLVIVVSILCSSIIKENEDYIWKMFGILGQLINKSKPLPGFRSDFRTELLCLCASLDQYPKYMDSLLRRKKQSFFMLTPSQQKAAIGNYQRLKEIETLYVKNAEFSRKIKEFAMNKYDSKSSEVLTAKPLQYTGVELIEHMVRDWACDAQNHSTRERLYSSFYPWIKDKKRILVPGSGVGGLASKLSALNPDAVVEALESSVPMHIGAEFAHATSSASSEYTVFPYITQFSHWRHGSDQLEPVHLEFGSRGHHTLSTHGNFLKSEKETRYDAVATSFFIDTAQNVFDYIEQIYNISNVNGVWCNVGPLKWGSAAFAEPSVDELSAFLRKNGWKISEFSDDDSNRYNGSEKSMSNTRYQSVKWTAVKIPKTESCMRIPLDK